MIGKRELWLLLVGLMLGSAAFAQTKVEVTLVDRLDEPRGFCFDTLGFQDRARPEEGLQTHSCYSYQGQLAVDQAFDGDLIPEGTFRLTEFDLCMTLTGAGIGSTFALEPCNGGELQQFEHRATRDSRTGYFAPCQVGASHTGLSRVTERGGRAAPRRPAHDASACSRNPWT